MGRTIAADTLPLKRRRSQLRFCCDSATRGVPFSAVLSPVPEPPCCLNHFWGRLDDLTGQKPRDLLDLFIGYVCQNLVEGGTINVRLLRNQRQQRCVLRR